jgi:hypothetical protein
MAINEKAAVTSNEGLNKKELAELERLEKKIDEKFESFLGIGEVLAEINAKKLYRSYGTFEDYCRIRWDTHRLTGYRRINAWETFSELKQIGYDKPFPNTESQYRELNIVKNIDDKVEVLDRLRDAHPNDPITARNIKEVRLALDLPTVDDAGKEHKPKTSKPKSNFHLSLSVDDVKIGKNGITFIDPDDSKVQGFISDIKQKLKDSGKIEIIYTPTKNKPKAKTTANKQKSKPAKAKESKGKPIKNTKETRDRLMRKYNQSKAKS